jgi:hypothetical protein
LTLMTEEMCPPTSVAIYQSQWHLHPTRTGSSSTVLTEPQIL